jgi:hypothetical protein
MDGVDIFFGLLLLVWILFEIAIQQAVYKKIESLKLELDRIKNPYEFKVGDLAWAINPSHTFSVVEIVARWYNDNDVSRTYECKTKDGFIVKLHEASLLEYKEDDTPKPKTSKKK